MAWCACSTSAADLRSTSSRATGASLMQPPSCPGTDTVVSGGEDGTLRRWASAAAAMLQAPVTTASFSPDGRRVLSGGPDGAVRIWNPSTGSVRVLPGHRSASVPQFSADGARSSAQARTEASRLWDAASGRSNRSCSPPPTPSCSPRRRSRRTPDRGRGRAARRSASCGSTAARARSLSGHPGVVRDVAFSPDGKQIASGSDDGTVRLWNAATGKLRADPAGHGQSVNSVAYSPDGDAS